MGEATTLRHILSELRTVTRGNASLESALTAAMLPTRYRDLQTPFFTSDAFCALAFCERAGFDWYRPKGGDFRVFDPATGLDYAHEPPLASRAITIVASAVLARIAKIEAAPPPDGDGAGPVTGGAVNCGKVGKLETRDG